MSSHLQAEYKTKDSGKRTLVSGHLVSWEASAAFPLAQIRASLGQAGELATETQVGLLGTTSAGLDYLSTTTLPDRLWRYAHICRVDRRMPLNASIST